MKRTLPVPERKALRPIRAIFLSIILHTAIFSGLLIWLQTSSVTHFVAAGEGEGGEGGGGSIEVGVTDPSSILGFAKPQNVSFVGDESNPINNARLESVRPESSSPEDALVPPTEKEKSQPDTVKTERPIAPQQEKIFTGKEERGSSTSQSAQSGRSYGSPTPSQSIGGVSLGLGGGQGAGTGLPGGSAYGRLIQQILSRNYNPPSVESATPQEVVILLKIARDGTILSIVNGRVAPGFIKQRSSNALITNAAERAILASNPLPAFPAGFLSSAQEAVAEVRFRYPK
jgi:membrane protein involved in colicin uptake